MGGNRFHHVVVLAVTLAVLSSMTPAASAAAPTETDVGLVDPDQGMWHLRNLAGEVTSFFFGNPGDLPIPGDWDGDGISTPGLYRQSDGFFYARNSNTQGIADTECFAGNPEDVPLSGDWDGDGDDNLGLYRPSEQMFYLFTISCTGTPMGTAQISFLFGNPGDRPVAGDWDGDGIDEVGLHRESTGFFYWRNTLTTGGADGQIFYGDPGDRFVAGDWGVVDGVDTPAVFRPSDTMFYFRHTLTQGVADSTADLGAAEWLPVAGSFGELKLPENIETVAETFAKWETAIRSQDRQFFLDTIHPQVLALYGATQCADAFDGEAFFSGWGDPLSTFTLAFLPPPPTLWEFLVDGVTLHVPNTHTVGAQGELVVLTFHLGIVGQQLNWFTDCGDPL